MFRRGVLALLFSSLLATNVAAAASPFSGPDPRKTYEMPCRMNADKPRGVDALGSRLGRLEQKANAVAARTDLSDAAKKQKIAKLETKAARMTVRGDVSFAQRLLRRATWIGNRYRMGGRRYDLREASGFLHDARRQREHLIDKHGKDVGALTRLRVIKAEARIERKWPQWDSPHWDLN